MQGAAIIGTGHYLPDTIIRNDFYESLNPLYIFGNDGEILKDIMTSDESISRMMGIKERRMASNNELMMRLGIRREYADIPDEDSVSMATNAAKAAMEDAGVEADDLDGIIVASISNPLRFPSIAAQVQNGLEAGNVSLAVDVSAACAGYCVALDYIWSKMQTSPGTYLAIGVEHLTAHTNYRSANCPLFGDGAGASIIGPAEQGKGIVASRNLSTSLGDKLMLIHSDPDGNLRMPKGSAVMKNAIQNMYRTTDEVLSHLGWAKDDVCLYIPHQANVRIIHGIGNKIFEDYTPSRDNANSQKIYLNIKRYGNMSAATCAVALSEARQKKLIKPRDKVILTAIGAGLQTSAIAIQF